MASNLLQLMRSLCFFLRSMCNLSAISVTMVWIASINSWSTQELFQPGHEWQITTLWHNPISKCLLFYLSFCHQVNRLTAFTSLYRSLSGKLLSDGHWCLGDCQHYCGLSIGLTTQLSPVWHETIWLARGWQHLVDQQSPCIPKRGMRKCQPP